MRKDITRPGHMVPGWTIHDELAYVRDDIRERRAGERIAIASIVLMVLGVALSSALIIAQLA